MFFEVRPKCHSNQTTLRLKWLSKFKQPFQMEAAGLQRYWTLTLLTLSYLVGTFLFSWNTISSPTWSVLFFLPITYLVTFFVSSVLSWDLFYSLLGLLIYLLKCNSGWRTWTFLAWLHKPRYGEVVEN